MGKDQLLRVLITEGDLVEATGILEQDGHDGRQRRLRFVARPAPAHSSTTAAPAAADLADPFDADPPLGAHLLVRGVWDGTRIVEASWSPTPPPSFMITGGVDARGSGAISEDDHRAAEQLIAASAGETVVASTRTSAGVRTTHLAYVTDAFAQTYAALLARGYPLEVVVSIVPQGRLTGP